MATQSSPARALVQATADDDLARQSAAAVRGVVRAVIVRKDAMVGALYTHVTIDVARAWGFQTAPRQVEIKLLGGSSGDESLIVGGQARFAVGEDVLALLDVRPRDRSLSVTGLSLGKWTLRPAAADSAVSGVREGQSFGVDATITRPAPDADTLATLVGSVVRLPEGPAPPWRAALGTAVESPPSNATFPGRWHEADWGVPVAVDAQLGGHPLFPGGGLSSLARAIAAWSGRRALSIQPGVWRGPRCFANAEAPDARISITYGDPCDEIADTSPVVAIGGVYVSSADVRVVGGVSYGRVTKGMVVLDNALTKFAGFSTGCYEELMTHEIGHAIGLGHTADDESIMSPWLSPTCVERIEGRALQPADLAALEAMYPPRSVTLGPPGPPVALMAQVAGTNVSLSWRPSPGPAAAVYQLSVGSMPGTSDLGTIAVGATSFDAIDVARGTYYVRATALNGDGASAPTPEVVVTVGSGLPGTPVGLLAAASTGGDVRVAWQAPTAGSTPLRYALLVGTASDTPSMRIPVATTSLTARGVPPGTYFVRAVAENDAGAGPASAQILVVVP